MSSSTEKLSPTFKQRTIKVYRSVLFQAVILGMIAFTQLGIRASITALGGGGLKKVSTSNAQSAILFAVMVPGAPIASILANRYGIQLSTFLGSTSGIFLSTALYQNSKDGNQWYIYFGAFLSGITTSFFWSAESTITILYPDNARRGLFIGIWQTLNTCGALIAGALAFGLNIHGKNTDSVTLVTYKVLIAIQCTGPIFGLLISPPEKITKPDGKKLKSNVIKSISVKERIMHYRTIVFRKEILCFLPLFLTTNWWRPFENNFIGKHFSGRVRGLNSFVTSIIGIIVNFFIVIFMDNKGISKKFKARYTWILAAAIKAAFYIFALFNVHWVKKNVPAHHRIDYDDWYFKRTYIPLLLASIGSDLTFNWMYWILGSFHFEPSEVSLIAGYIRSTESLGQTVAFAVIKTHPDLMLNGILSCCMYFSSLPFVSWAAWRYVDENDVAEHYQTEEDEEKDIESTLQSSAHNTINGSSLNDKRLSKLEEVENVSIGENLESNQILKAPDNDANTDPETTVSKTSV